MIKAENHFILIIQGVDELNLLVQLDSEMVARLENIRTLKLSYLLGRMQTLSLDRCILLVTALLDQTPRRGYDTVSIPLLLKDLRIENQVNQDIVNQSSEKILGLNEIYQTCKYHRDKFLAHIENIGASESARIIENHKSVGFAEFAKVAKSLSNVCDLIGVEIFSKQWMVTRSFDDLAEVQQVTKMAV